MTTREDMLTRLPSAVAESVSTAGQTFCATGMSLPFNKFMLVVEYHSISYMLIVECVRIPSCNTLQNTIYAFTTERICQLCDISDLSCLSKTFEKTHLQMYCSENIQPTIHSSQNRAA